MTSVFLYTYVDVVVFRAAATSLYVMALAARPESRLPYNFRVRFPVSVPLSPIIVTFFYFSCLATKARRKRLWKTRVVIDDARVNLFQARLFRRRAGVYRLTQTSLFELVLLIVDQVPQNLTQT